MGQSFGVVWRHNRQIQTCLVLATRSTVFLSSARLGQDRVMTELQPLVVFRSLQLTGTDLATWRLGYDTGIAVQTVRTAASWSELSTCRAIAVGLHWHKGRACITLSFSGAVLHQRSVAEYNCVQVPRNDTWLLRSWYQLSGLTSPSNYG